MLDAVAHATAVRLIANETRSALPNSPSRPDRHRNGLRRRASFTFRWLANRLDPVPAEYRDGPYRREATTT